MSETCRVIINQVKQKLHLVGYLLTRYFKDARYHERLKKCYICVDNFQLTLVTPFCSAVATSFCRSLSLATLTSPGAPHRKAARQMKAGGGGDSA